MYKLLQMTTATVTLIIGLVGSAVAASQTNTIQPTTTEIASGVYSFSPGKGYHSMFVVTNEGVAVFETVNSGHATEMLKAIRQITDKPIKYALHSHNHWDHSSGGSVMQKAGADTVMHLLASQWLAANPGRDTSTPNIIWEGARSDITLGNITIEMHHLGMSHGLGMSVFVIPERRVAYIADLVSPNRVMFSIVPDFNIGEWERTLGEILALDFDKAVCTHNGLPTEEAAKGCTKIHVADQRGFIQDLRNAIFAEFKKGTALSDIPGVIKLPKYAHWNHYEDWLALNAQRLLLDLWMGPYPWTPTK